MARPIDLKSARQANQLRDKGLSYRAIARIMRLKDHKLVFLWCKYKKQGKLGQEWAVDK